MPFRWLVVVALAGCFSKPGLRDSDAGSSGDDASPIDMAPLIDTTGDTLPIPAGACPAIYVPDLVAFYNFEEGSGTTADDGVQDSLEGTIDDAMFGGGRNVPGSALNFQTSDAVVLVGSQPAVTNLPQITVCAWFRMRAQQSEVSAILMDKSRDGSADGWNAYLNTDDVPSKSYIAFYTPFHAYKMGTSAIVVDQWTHGCMTWNGTSGSAGINIYKNGGPDGTRKQEPGDLTVRANDTGHSLAIGRAKTDTPPVFSFLGDIDEIALYRRALTQDEILGIYECD